MKKHPENQRFSGCFLMIKGRSVGSGVQILIPAPRRSKVRITPNALAGIGCFAPLLLLSVGDPLTLGSPAESVGSGV